MPAGHKGLLRGRLAVGGVCSASERRNSKGVLREVGLKLGSCDRRSVRWDWLPILGRGGLKKLGLLHLGITVGVFLAIEVTDRRESGKGGRELGLEEDDVIRHPELSNDVAARRALSSGVEPPESVQVLVSRYDRGSRFVGMIFGPEDGYLGLTRIAFDGVHLVAVTSAGGGEVVIEHLNLVCEDG